MGEELAVREQEQHIISAENTWLNPRIVLQQVIQVAEVRDSVMKKEEHYGRIPGTKKDTLYKAGAEILGLAFNLDVQYEENIIQLENEHREYEDKAIVYSRVTGMRLGSGVGSCSTMESKYRWRQSKLHCPECGSEALYKDKKGNGWYCWRKKDGCGATFDNDDERITRQDTNRIENPDIADTYNTVKKMAKKRAFVDAILTVTAASGMFTQDLEELVGLEGAFEFHTKEKSKPQEKQDLTKDGAEYKNLYEKAEILAKQNTTRKKYLSEYHGNIDGLQRVVTLWEQSDFVKKYGEDAEYHMAADFAREGDMQALEDLVKDIANREETL
jgi:hypothetical protein